MTVRKLLLVLALVGLAAPAGVQTAAADHAAATDVVAILPADARLYSDDHETRQNGTERSFFRVGNHRLPVKLPSEKSPFKLSTGQNTTGLAVD